MQTSSTRTWLSILLLSALALPAWSADREYQLRVDGLACPYCAYGIEKKIRALNGVDEDSVTIRINEGLVVFQADTEAPIGEAKLKQLINDAGFTLRSFEHSEEK
ncbi:heavy-metal-associated domain-containing protein [Marinobacter sp. NP-4(2019)]|uniref:heavy-metal-associated domain-containing protein n=1 Tax=Marinobacter sp. NP-4(2019) TaxID=2488665 RepID=UPI00197CC73F|nr:heavy-metal-associated domain-containing protein [Marinobacter sp. NP-4(2019)]